MAHNLRAYIQPRPEHRFLLACTGLPMHPTTIERARLILQEKFDWTYFFRLAEEHGMLWVAYTQIATHFADQVPASLLQAWRAPVEQNQFKNIWATSELLRLLDRFTEQRLTVLPYKGPLLAEWLYGSLALRRFGDLDLLIRVSDYWQVHRILLAEGYCPSLALSDSATAALVRYQCERTLYHPTYRIGIDLHWGIWLGHAIFVPERAGVWQRARTTTLAGKSVVAMSPQDTLLLLAIHGTTHRWRGLSWLMDLGQMIRRVNLDWEWIAHQATRLGIRRIVWLALYLASELTDAALPPSVHAAIEQDANVARLAIQVCKELFLPPREVPIEQDLPFHLRARERWTDKLNCLISLISAPSSEDITWVSLPSPLFPLYRMVRLWRLSTKYGSAFLRRALARG